MEMTWLETVEFIGLDLQVGLTLGLLVLEILERALHSAWGAFSDRLRGARVVPVAAPRIAVGQSHRI